MTVVDLYTIQIIQHETPEHAYDSYNMSVLIAETEENVTDLLPPGFKARIRRWDHDDEPEPFVPDTYHDDTSPEALRNAGWTPRRKDTQ